MDARGPQSGPLGKAADELIEEFFGANLELEWVTAVFDADVEKLTIFRFEVSAYSLYFVVQPLRTRGWPIPTYRQR